MRYIFNHLQLGEKAFSILSRVAMFFVKGLCRELITGVKLFRRSQE
jgi:hypothetical protein